VEPTEVDEVVAGDFHMQICRGGRYSVLGRSDAGRYLFVVLEEVAEEGWFCVTARPMRPRERTYYRRGGK